MRSRTEERPSNACCVDWHSTDSPAGAGRTFSRALLWTQSQQERRAPRWEHRSGPYFRARCLSGNKRPTNTFHRRLSSWVFPQTSRTAINGRDPSARSLVVTRGATPGFGTHLQKAARWWRTVGSPPLVPGSTTTRSNRRGNRGTRLPSGNTPRSRRPYVAIRRRVRFRWSTVSSGRPKPRDDRQRTSTITSASGGPGSTATTSSSWRPTWTFRARTVQPAARSRTRTSDSAASPAC